jgi:NadR type nicotinamide-nucleotide adenylyltransferase
MKKKWKTGLVIGKFLPPHRGHSHLIETALSQVEQLTIIVCERPSEIEFLTGELRASWLRDLFPDARVLVVEDHYDETDSALWAHLTVEWLGGKPDVVFTSENYGAAYTKYLGCDHVLVDLNRESVPISATRIRANVYANWDFLEAPARAYFAKRVVLLGAESSGTTTLALDLARHYNTVWVPEYGRDYCEAKYTRGDNTWRSEEFLHIAREQKKRENELARHANRVLICDTDAFATHLWHWRYCGFFEPLLELDMQLMEIPDLYLLTDVNIPFVQDGVRDGEHIRHEMHKKFIEELEKQPGAPWQLVSGSREERQKRAVQLIDELLHQDSQNLMS